MHPPRPERVPRLHATRSFPSPRDLLPAPAQRRGGCSPPSRRSEPRPCAVVTDGARRCAGPVL
eukprot:15454140-Alexandrium_andersonii.AAC.1